MSDQMDGDPVCLLVKANGPVSAIAVRNALNSYGSVVSVRPLRDSYVVEIMPQNPPINIPASLCAGKAILDIRPHTNASSSHQGVEGTIYSTELADCDEETLLSELADEEGEYQVLSVKQLPSRGRTKQSGRWLIRFRSALPETVRLRCKLQLSVRLHVRMALRCKSCQEYGHHLDECKNAPVCPNCSLPAHPGTPCTRVCCPGCGGPHAVEFLYCPRFRYEMELKRLSLSKGISKDEAAALLLPGGPCPMPPNNPPHTAPIGASSAPSHTASGIIAAHTTLAAPTTYAEAAGQGMAQAQSPQVESKLIALLTEQTSLLRNMAAQPSLANLLEKQTETLNCIKEQNLEILAALRCASNPPAAPSTVPARSPITSTPIRPQSDTPSTPDTVETLAVSPPPTGKKRRAVITKKSMPPDKPKGKN